MPVIGCLFCLFSFYLMNLLSGCENSDTEKNAAIILKLEQYAFTTQFL